MFHVPLACPVPIFRNGRFRNLWMGFANCQLSAASHHSRTTCPKVKCVRVRGCMRAYPFLFLSLSPAHSFILLFLLYLSVSVFLSRSLSLSPFLSLLPEYATLGH